MRPGNLSTPTGKLNLSTKKILARWDDCNAIWTDPVSRAFRETQIGGIEQQVHAVLREMQRLGTVIAQAYHDCS
jgi:hypothetical protein